LKQEKLAEELTKRVHSKEDYESVLKVSELLFNKKANADFLRSLDAKTLTTVAEEIPSVSLSTSDFESAENVVDLLVEKCQLLPSNGEARRAIKGNAISINKTKISDHNAVVSSDELLCDRFIMVENGKKNKFMIVVG